MSPLPAIQTPLRPSRNAASCARPPPQRESPGRRIRGRLGPRPRVSRAFRDLSRLRRACFALHAEQWVHEPAAQLRGPGPAHSAVRRPRPAVRRSGPAVRRRSRRAPAARRRASFLRQRRLLHRRRSGPRSRRRRGRVRARPGRRRAAPGPFPGPRALLARLQRTRAGAGRGPGDADPGAGQLPGDLRLEPGRVLHGPGGRAQAPHRHRRRHPVRLRPPAPRGARPHLDPLARAHGPARRLLPAGHRPGPLRRVDPAHPVAGSDREGAGPPLHLLPAARLPRADPAGRRPRAPLPVHLGSLAQPRRRRPQPGQRPPPLRPGQGPAAADPLPGGVAAAVRAHRGRHRGPPGGAVPGDGGAGAPHVPGHQERGPGGRGGRRGEPAPGAGEGADAAPVRSPGAAGGRGVHRPVRPGSAGPRAEGVRRGGLPAARPPGPDRPLRHRLAGPAGAEVPEVHRGHPPGPGRGGVRLRARHLRGPARAGRAAPPPVRLVLHLRPGLPGAGGGRPGRAGHQADAVPHLRRLPDSGRPHRRGRVRQAGPRPRRDQGPASTSRPTSSGPASWRRRAAMSCTASSG